MGLVRQLYRPGSPVGAFMAARLAHTEPLRRAWDQQLSTATTIQPRHRDDRLARVGLAFEYRIGLALARTPPYPWLLALLADHERTALLRAAGYTRTQRPARPVPPVNTDELVGELARWRRPATTRQPRRRALAHQPLSGRRRQQPLLDTCYRLAALSQIFGPLDQQSTSRLSPQAATQFWRTHLRRDLDRGTRDDLWALWRAFLDHGHHRLARAGAPVVIAPTFITGFATGDLITGRTLIDIKTTATPHDQLDHWLLQLVAYALLDHGDHYRLNRIGVYLARQATLVTWPLPTLLRQLTGDPATSLPSLRTEFRQLLETDPTLDHPDLGHATAAHRWLTRDPPHPPAPGAITPPPGDGRHPNPPAPGLARRSQPRPAARERR